MKKILCILFIIILSLSFVACSNNSETETASYGGEGDPLLVLDNVNARLALSMACDKDFIVNEILANGSAVLNNGIPSGFFIGPKGTKFEGEDFVATAKKNKSGLYYDPKKAAELWLKAKKEVGFDTVKMEMLISASEVGGKLAEHMQEEFETNLEGLKIELIVLPGMERISRVMAGEYHMTVVGWGASYHDPATFLELFITDFPYNDQGYSNHEYDELMKKANETTDPKEHWQALLDAEAILLKDPAVAPLYQTGQIWLQNPSIKNIYRHSFGGIANSFKWVDIDANEKGNKILKLLSLADIFTLDSTNSTDFGSAEIINHISEGLVRLTKGDTIAPGLAESIEKSEDGLTYTFNLRKGIKWITHTGKVYGEVTARDFEYSWNRLIDPKTASENVSKLIDTGKVKSFKAIDDYTFEVKLKRNIDYFKAILPLCYLQPINEKFKNEVGDKYGTSNEYILNCGPFYLKEWDVSNKMILVKNPYYWDKETVNLDEINYRIINGIDNNTEISLYLEGSTDIAELKGENVMRYMDREDAVIYKSAAISSLYFNINKHKD
ncbi:ABC transporter substrate-binding protein [Clostridiaceae bacterium M8S5]|nr:ABC transporter substrate-binding protein [Clostridiaceae bacterium M8S5]